MCPGAAISARYLPAPQIESCPRHAMMLDGLEGGTRPQIRAPMPASE